MAAAITIVQQAAMEAALQRRHQGATILARVAITVVVHSLGSASWLLLHTFIVHAVEPRAARSLPV